MASLSYRSTNTVTVIIVDLLILSPSDDSSEEADRRKTREAFGPIRILLLFEPSLSNVVKYQLNDDSREGQHNPHTTTNNICKEETENIIHDIVLLLGKKDFVRK